MICCVEDDPGIREWETDALHTTGLDSCGFEDGQVFRQTLPIRQPDLVITEIDILCIGTGAKEYRVRKKAWT